MSLGDTTPASDGLWLAACMPPDDSGQTSRTPWKRPDGRGICWRWREPDCNRLTGVTMKSEQGGQKPKKQHGSEPSRCQDVDQQKSTPVPVVLFVKTLFSPDF